MFIGPAPAPGLQYQHRMQVVTPPTRMAGISALRSAHCSCHPLPAVSIPRGFERRGCQVSAWEERCAVCWGLVEARRTKAERCCASSAASSASHCCSFDTPTLPAGAATRAVSDPTAHHQANNKCCADDMRLMQRRGVLLVHAASCADKTQG